ncbi:unnamed protein product [Caenorhabditis nigoni]
MIGLEIPIHMFGVFCILFRTPGSMRSVKWGMLNLHVWSMGLDLGVSLLTIPYILYPALAGFTLGVLTDFDVPMAYQAYMLAVLIGHQASALKEVFKMLPELPQELYDAPVFVLATDFRYVVIPVFIMSNLLVTESGCFILAPSSCSIFMLLIEKCVKKFFIANWKIILDDGPWFQLFYDYAEKL